MEKVDKIDWSTQDGLVEYRLVYDDGSCGSVVTTAIKGNDPDLARKMALIEQRWLGKNVKA